MVGGTSSIRSLQRQVEATLGAKLEFGIDPLTVVAQGAAIYAAGQRRALKPEKVSFGLFHVELEYSPVGADTIVPVGGRVSGPAD